MIEPEHYSLQMAHEATGYTREHLICLGAEGKIDFYVKNLRGYVVALQDDDVNSYFEELSKLEYGEDRITKSVTVNDKEYVNIRFDYESDCNYQDIDDYAYHLFDTLPNLCKIPACTLEDYHVSRKKAYFRFLQSPSEGKTYYLCENIAMVDVQLYISKQDVAKLLTKEAVTENILDSGGEVAEMNANMAIAIMALLLSQKAPKYKKGEKPNASAISNEILPLAQHFFGDNVKLSAFNKKISTALKTFEEEKKGDDLDMDISF